MQPEDVTMVRDAIHNPGDPRHFMRVVPADRPQIAKVGNVVVAHSASALLVKEVGFDIYDPVVYFPRADVRLETLVKTEKSTHCPLKGDTEYFDASIEGQHLSDLAWSYPSPIPQALVMTGYIAFDSAQVEVVAL